MYNWTAGGVVWQLAVYNWTAGGVVWQLAVYNWTAGGVVWQLAVYNWTAGGVVWQLATYVNRCTIVTLACCSAIFPVQPMLLLIGITHVVEPPIPK